MEYEEIINILKLRVVLHRIILNIIYHVSNIRWSFTFRNHKQGPFLDFYTPYILFLLFSYYSIPSLLLILYSSFSLIILFLLFSFYFIPPVFLLFYSFSSSYTLFLLFSYYSIPSLHLIFYSSCSLIIIFLIFS